MKNTKRGNMLNKELTIGYNQKRVKISVKECNLLEKSIGLMFSSRENAKILLFSFNKKQRIAIHSFFVFYNFLAVWLDNSDKVVDLKIVKPFRPCVFPSRDAFKLVEIPINRNNKNIISFFRR